jgi:hypothetical protein
MNHDMQPFVACAVDRLAPMYERFLSSDVFAERIRAHYAEQWSARTDLRACAELARTLAIAGRSAEDYALRCLDLGKLGMIIAGIHFSNLDPTKPFVGVLAQTRELDSAELFALRDALLDEFAAFAPRSIWIFVAGDRSRSAQLPGARPDQRVFIGPIESLRARPRPAGHARMTLRPPGPDMYRRFHDAYEQLFAVKPELRPLLPVEDEDSLRAAHACFEAWIDDQWAGLVAAGIGDFMGLGGYYMLTQVLAARFRGQGMGPVMQRQLIERLEPRHDGLLWGTIDASNQPSLRTAARIGRSDVGGWVFLDA